jgi:integrase
MRIVQLPSGKWQVRVSYQEDGRQREISKSFSRRREAEAWQRQHEVDRDHGRLRRPSRQPLQAYLEHWLRTLTGIGGRTFEDYANISRRYLIPALGRRRLDQLTPPMVREMLATLTARGLSARTVIYVRAVLRRALNQAMGDGLIMANPAAGRGMVPKLVQREMRVLGVAEVNRVLSETRNDPCHALWAVLLTTGMRPSEALALRWPDMSFERAEIRVQRKLRRPMQGAAWKVEDCKTDKSRRVIPLVPLTVEALRKHHDRQAVERLVANGGYADHEFVFADPRGEPLRGDGVTNYSWRPMLVKLNLPHVRLYDCRHSAATMRLESGVPMKVVQEILGHSSITVTGDIYSHVTPAFGRQAAEALAGFLGRAE